MALVSSISLCFRTNRVLLVITRFNKVNKPAKHILHCTVSLVVSSHFTVHIKAQKPSLYSWDISQRCSALQPLPRNYLVH